MGGNLRLGRIKLEIQWSDGKQVVVVRQKDLLLVLATIQKGSKVGCICDITNLHQKNPNKFFFINFLFHIWFSPFQIVIVSFRVDKVLLLVVRREIGVDKINVQKDSCNLFPV